jgi:hypothetical protein
MKGLVIAEFYYEKLKNVKGLCDSRWLHESLNPTVERIPTERPKTTISCGQNPTVEGIPTERPETTISCVLNPIVEGIPIKQARGNNRLRHSSHREGII